MMSTKEQRKTPEQIREEAERQYLKLRFTDDFLFCKIMEDRPDIARDLVELILNRKISKVVVKKQEPIEITSDGRGIRLDVYAEDEENTIYDLEMQTTIHTELGKRSRYYQGMIDLDIMKRGYKYDELRKTYIIFLCMKDPFGRGKHIYSFENRCIEENEVTLGDETYKIFLNASGTDDAVSENLLDFFRVMRTGEGNTDLARKIQGEVDRARRHEEWRTEYMTLFMRDQEMKELGRKEGRAEGRAEGIEEGRAGILRNMLNAELDEEIIQKSGFTRDEIKQIQSEK